MTGFDPSQLRALTLDPRRHARILGAPGTGKTRVLVEVFRRLLDDPGWGEGDVLALAPGRLVAAALRGEVERAVGRAIGGTPTRTPASLAFAVLARAAALAGEAAPRLLTGTAQDEEIAAVLERALAAGALPPAAFTPEVVRSPAFRAELRELWRVVDDFDLAPSALADALAGAREGGAREAHSRAPAPELLEKWLASLRVLEAVSARLAAERPGELSSSALLRAAAAAIRGRAGAERGELALPRLVLVDDAQELGEGELGLLAAVAAAGGSVWVFGDPDVATGAFHGERTAVLSRLGDELARRGGAARAAGSEQVAVLERVHRHGPVIRDLVRHLTSRIGAAGAGAQRAAGAGPLSVDSPDPKGASSQSEPAVQFAAVASPAEQLGAIAHRLRARRLGLEGPPLAWTEMAVLCRSRAEAARAARVLAAHQVPTGVAAGGLVLREHQVVRELIRLLQHCLGIRPLAPDEVLELVRGVLGGLDPVAVRRLRGELLIQERREAREADREARGIDALVAEAFAVPGAEPVVDSAGGRALRRLARVAAEGVRVREAGGTPREVLWAVWDGAGLAPRWQADALEGRGARSDEAHRSLDAVLGLFFALQRHEEQDSAQPVPELLEDLLLSAVPEDTLAQRSQREAVTVTTPQGAIGREFAVVAVVGLQDGAWPNLRARGSLLGAAALERWLRGGEAVPPSRRDTIHDELRLFAHSCARARREVLVVAIADEDHHPSPFFGLGAEHRRDGVPSTRLTLRGATAEMRRRLVRDPDDLEALRSLAALAREGVPGAHPDEWYGVLPPSTEAPLVDLAGDPERRVAVSPSQLERAERCPLDWVISSLGGGRPSVQSSLGTLLHHALETAERPDADALFETVLAEWDKLPFDAEWESERTRRLARAMAEGLAAYLREFEGSDRRLAGRETAFEFPAGRALVRGVADRLELRELPDGGREVTVLDLKTGRTPPSRREAEQHAQLQAYQLGVALGAFAPRRGEPGDAGTPTDGGRAPDPDLDLAGARSGGARLLYVHPDATRGSGFVERTQEPLGEEAMAAFADRVAEAAWVLAAGTFTARVEHHCSDPHQPGECRLHVVRAVSHS